MADKQLDGNSAPTASMKAFSISLESPLVRKRLHPSDTGIEVVGGGGQEDLIPSAKRSPPVENEGSDVESVTSGPGSYSPPSRGKEGSEQPTGGGEDSEPLDPIQELPPDALLAINLTQFATKMKPYLWVKYPAATSSEITSIIHSRWRVLRNVRREQAGEIGAVEKRRRSEVDALGGSGEVEEEEEGGGRKSRRRAAKNLARNAYTSDLAEDLEYVDSPASSTKDSTGSGTGKRGGRGKGSRKKVPPMKIKLIGRSGADSPIFFAESLGDLDEGSGSERGFLKESRRSARKIGGDSETSSLQFEERDSDEVEPSEEEDEFDELEELEEDSEGEHADFCSICKDGGQLLCCDECPLAYHLTCLTPPMEVIPDGEWSCPRCEAEPLGGKVERIVTWRWREIPLLPPRSSDSEDLDDDVIQDESPAKKPLKTYRIREFLVKWVGKSNWKNSWVSEIRMDVFQQTMLRFYMRKHKMEHPPSLELPPHVEHRYKRRSTASHHDAKMEEKEMMLIRAGIRPEWLQIHRVINKRSTRKGTQYLVKWRDLPYDQATWEHLGEDCGLKGAAIAVKLSEQLRHMMDPSKSKKKRGRHKHVTNPKEKYEEQPRYVSATGGTLHPYQLEGLNWLRFSWAQKTNTILADEMGLGKTIQTIAFLYSLVKEGHSNGPFLITAPLSTIVNWEREFEFWGPELYVVTYTGDKENRATIREHDFSFMEGAIKGGASKLYKMKKDAPVKFHVLLTSYEFVSVDATVLQSIDWDVLIVDEAHRLKNNQSKFFRVLSMYNLKYKLLLTGTPLQNNLEELFHLLNFLNPQSFNSLEQFQDEFQDISKEEQVQKLHELLAPHLLRRLKADVLKTIPSKRELIVRVELSPMQKKYYRWILTRNFEKLNQRGTQPVSLLNVMMDLKKCCNHPYLFPTASQEAPLTITGYYEGKALVLACGKFIVLEKMLKKLKQQGHRILIFSQMTRMLDILEDFLEYLGYQYERIDGSVNGAERQQYIDRFNAPGAPQFVFLLSTRAGGLGINLATADTVIIYDSDWNPHNDIQAFSRAHRIGQAKKVMIYRFVTRCSVEERITEVAKRKMMLTHLVVRSGIGSSSTPSLSKRELDDILRFGTEDLFKDNKEGEESSIHYDDDAIEALLDRSHEEEGEVGPGENLLANEYLSSFKVASYVMKEKDEEMETEIIKEESDQQADPDFWEKLLRHHYEQQRELEAAKLGKGKRVRKQVNYLDASGGLTKSGRDSDQSSYQQSSEEETDEESDEDVEFPGLGMSKRRGKLKAVKPGTEGALPPLLAKVNDIIQVLGFNPRQRKAFLNAVMRFGMPPPNSFHSKWRPRELRNMSENAFNAYVNMFLRHLCEPDNPNKPTYSDDIPKESIARQSVLTRIGIMRLVRNKIEQYADLNGEYSLPEETLPAKKPSVIQGPANSQPSENGGGEAKSEAKSEGGASENLEQNIVKEENTSRTSDSVVKKEPDAKPSESHASGSPKLHSPVPDSAAVRKEDEPMEVDSTGAKPEPMETDSAAVEKEPSPTATAEVKKEIEKPEETPPPQQQQTQAQEGKKESVIMYPSASKEGSKFMFNIADGGFTELHSVWAEEKTRGFTHSVWGRHHDYWLLKGIVTHGYCRWTEICGDSRFALLNKSFAPDEFVSDSKSRFLLRRFKLLEQALAVEEQLHRASNAGLVQDPNHSVMQLHSRYTDLDCLADGHQYLVKECMGRDRNSIILLRKALAKMEELLMEMKSDVSHLPSELSKIPSVSTQLKMDEISTLSKLAKKSVSATPSVITQSTTTASMKPSSGVALVSAAVAHPKPATPSVKSEKSKPTTKEGGKADMVIVQDVNAQAAAVTQYPVAYATAEGTIVQGVQLAAGSVVQTADGVMYAIQQQPASTTAQNSSQAQNTYAAIGVPTYMDGNMAYIGSQTVQLVPVSTGNQVVYWPSVVQQGSGSQTQLAVVQGSQALLQPVQYSSVEGSDSTHHSSTGKSSIITID